LGFCFKEHVKTTTKNTFNVKKVDIFDIFIYFNRVSFT